MPTNSQGLPIFADMVRYDFSSGTDIAEAAKVRLQNQPHVATQRIWCEYHQGHLFLRGQVPSYYHKQLAQVAVAGLEGVEQVVNEIEVVW